MPEINELEIHSEEIQELMGFIPKGVVRWGLTVIFLILSGIIIGSYFFRSPEIITAPIVLTTENPPLELLSKSTGKIDRLFVQDGQKLDAGTLVALINNPTSYQDYLLLKEGFLVGSDTSTWDQQVLTIELPDQLTLGELQAYYSSFLKNRNSFKHYLKQKLIPKKIELLKRQIAKQIEYYQTQLRQRDIQLKDLSLSGKAFDRDSVLFNKQAVSESEYEKARQTLLVKKAVSIGFDASLKNTESSILQMRQNSVELQMQYEKELAQFRLDLDESKQNLENLMHQWEEKYLVTSPIVGKISYTSVWTENQEVKAGELIGTVIPQGDLTIIAKAIIPTAGFGKVEVGQRVNIKLSGFPYMQFGMLKGRIRSVSLVPESKGYVAEIELKEGMTTSYKENLKFIQQMDGTAEIVTKDLRLIYRFINPLRALFDNGL
ncbi:MAG: HlyD family efflux transporter periplasmic adaptor subunit [Bacteroidota bacterium]|nr:HlyD family efflux transporter periplasmic adaptor subunit [Bacteroidota bacterium]